MRRVIALSALAVLSTSMPVAAQGRVTTESIANLGRFESVQTAEALALGLTRTLGLDNAGDAARNPAGLIRGPRVDVIGGLAGSQVRLNRYTSYSSTNQGFVHQHARIPGPHVIRGLSAAALRRTRWAIGGFYDDTTTFRHEFATGNRLLSRPVTFRGCNETTGQTVSSVAVDRLRIGGGFALAITESLAVGFSAEAARLRADVQSVSDITNLMCGIGGFPGTTTEYIESGQLTADQWKGGTTLGATLRPRTDVVVSFVWQRAPAYAAPVDVRQRFRDGRPVGPLAVAGGGDRRFVASLDVPDSLSAGAAWTARMATVTGEIAWTDNRILRNSSLLLPDPVALEQTGGSLALNVRGGLEWRFPAGNARTIAVRAGLSHEGPAGLKPVEPRVGTTVPLDAQRWMTNSNRRTWITTGGAFEISAFEVAAAFAATSDERRFLVTTGARLP